MEIHYLRTCRSHHKGWQRRTPSEYCRFKQCVPPASPPSHSNGSATIVQLKWLHLSQPLSQHHFPREGKAFSRKQSWLTIKMASNSNITEAAFPHLPALCRAIKDHSCFVYLLINTALFWAFFPGRCLSLLASLSIVWPWQLKTNH